MSWAFRVPVALFGTWALIATFVNFGQVVVAFGGSINALAAAGLLAVAMAIGAYAIWRTREAVIFAVMLWAGVGIAVKQSDLTLLLSAIVITTIINAAVTWFALKQRGAATA